MSTQLKLWKMTISQEEVWLKERADINSLFLIISLYLIDPSSRSEKMLSYRIRYQFMRIVSVVATTTLTDIIDFFREANFGSKVSLCRAGKTWKLNYAWMNKIKDEEERSSTIRDSSTHSNFPRSAFSLRSDLDGRRLKLLFNYFFK